MKNYYEVLEVSPNASQEVIEKAYKALAKKYHPDRFSGNKTFAENKFKEIQEAYTILSDQSKRHEYDITLSSLNAETEASYENLAQTNDNLSQENVKLKKEISYLKSFRNNFNTKHSFESSIKKIIEYERNKTKEDHINSIKALILTIIIIALILLIITKIPFFHDVFSSI